MSENDNGSGATEKGVDVEALKSELEKQSRRADDFKSDMLKYKDENKTLAEKFAELEKRLPNQDDLDLLQQAKKSNDDKKSDDEKLKKQIEELKATYDARVLEAEKIASDANIRFANHAIEAEIAKLTGSKVVDGSMQDVMSLLKSQLEVKEGQVVVMDNVDPEITPETVVNDFLKSKPYYLKPDQLQSGSGGNGQASKAGDAGKTALNLAQRVNEGKMKAHDAKAEFWKQQE